MAASPHLTASPNAVGPLLRIPFTKPSLTGLETTCVEEAIRSGCWSGDGPFSQKCHLLLESLTGCRVFLAPSGTAALELALMALEPAPGDEVILPSYTFVSTANAVVQMRLTPVFVDIRPDTLNLDERLIEQALTKRTRAVLPVHYAGIAADMDSINEISRKHGLAVVEDAAQGVNAFYKGRALGSLGDLGAFSFHQTKNFTCGEGGAVTIPNREYLGKIEIHRQKGTDKSRFLRGQVDKYSWIDRGSSYLLSDLLAAFLYAQLKDMETNTKKRETLFHYYLSNLKPIAQDRFDLPHVPDHCQPNYHLFYVILKRCSDLEPLMTHLKGRGIETATHFVPLHSSRGGKKFGVVRGPMTVTENAGANLLRLPLYPQMTFEEQDHVIKCVGDFFHSR